MSLVPTVKRRIRRLGGKGEELLQRVLATVGFAQSDSQISADSQKYWNDTRGERWRSDSHWHDASVFASDDLWSRIGRTHLELFQRGARTVQFDRPWNRVVEWGCGGGANAVHFGKLAGEFVGVDISQETIDECERRVAEHADTPFRGVLIEVAEPERAVAEIGTCDVFLCFYVFELIPSPEYGERLLKIARDVLAPGGVALIQIKYDEGRFWTRSRRRAYRRSVAEMTTYPIAEFWQLAQRCGLRPETIELVPKNELDERYAYFLLSRP
ncbi:MAG TPA: class I SAM-dependent methyltransferase [Actinophytocola sp.]|jgi:SAM-dependent methyltransferase|nr:class I SAM-dependent methyltransferase [Actinophytocola sp.]